VEYDVYYRLNGTNLIKLNLTVCSNSKIFIYVPHAIIKNVDEFNSSSGYYKDICYSITSDDGTDISIKDRQREFIDKNKFVCQEYCDFSEYNYTIYTAKCLCKIKEIFQSFSEMKIDKTKLLENFINIKNIVNVNFLVCYKKLFNNEAILNNVGSYLILAIVLFHLITIMIFNIKSFHSVKKIIVNILVKTEENKKEKKKDDSKKMEVSRNKVYII
jgi:hypothetical protein